MHEKKATKGNSLETKKRNKNANWIVEKEKEREFQRVQDWRQLDLFITDLQSAKRKRRIFFLFPPFRSFCCHRDTLPFSRAHTLMGFVAWACLLFCLFRSIVFPDHGCRRRLCDEKWSGGRVSANGNAMNLIHDMRERNIQMTGAEDGAGARLRHTRHFDGMESPFYIYIFCSHLALTASICSDFWNENRPLTQRSCGVRNAFDDSTKLSTRWFHFN